VSPIAYSPVASIDQRENFGRHERRQLLWRVRHRDVPRDSSVRFGPALSIPTTINGLTLFLAINSVMFSSTRHSSGNGWDVQRPKSICPSKLVTTDEIERIWQKHRKGQSPESFTETALQLRGTITSRSELLVPPTYSTSVDEVCPRCEGGGAFPLCDPRQILSMLGYCRRVTATPRCRPTSPIHR
jgi:hypothetical protein